MGQLEKLAAAILIVLCVAGGYIAYIALGQETLESRCRKEPELLEAISANNDEVTTEVKGNHIYYRYDITAQTIDELDDRYDIVLQTEIHPLEDDLTDLVNKTEAATGIKGIQVTLIFVNNDTVLYEETFDSNGRIE